MLFCSRRVGYFCKMREQMSLQIPVSWGEFFDKMTILQIKQERVRDDGKLKNIKKELKELCHVRDAHLINNQQLPGLVDALRDVNAVLWQIEDDIRACERSRDFGSRFVELARSVYKTNDQRAELKYRINMLLDSEMVEEKSYEAY